MTSLDGGPLYKGVQRALMEQLASGDLKPGQLIPSERQLALEFNVSIGTLRKAIDELVENRILIRQQGKGTFVSSHDRERLLFYFFHIVPQKGAKSYPLVESVFFHKSVADDEVSARLKIAIGAPTFHIRNKLSLVGVPVAVVGMVGYVISGWRVPNLPEYSLGFVYLPALLAIVAASVLTAPFGARLAHRLPVATMKRVFALLLYLLATKMVVSYW